jgi:hypothetical protein
MATDSRAISSVAQLSVSVDALTPERHAARNETAWCRGRANPVSIVFGGNMNTKPKELAATAIRLQHEIIDGKLR